MVNKFLNKTNCVILVFFFIFFSIINNANAEVLTNKLSGKILLQVEDCGQAWYIEPSTKHRAFLGKPDDAFKIMRELGLGISESTFNTFNTFAPINLSGKILLRVEARGEAYYVNPGNLKMHYLGKPTDAFNVMRNLGLGISTENINKIPVHEKYKEKKYGEFGILYKSTNIIDGDTIKVEIDGIEESIRLIGVDTPEMQDSRNMVECFATEAKSYLEKILINKSFSLESDQSQGERDKYNRLLKYIILDDGTNINKAIIENGFGFEYTYNLPYKYQTEFISAEKLAMKNKFGLWADEACKKTPTEDVLDINGCESKTFCSQMTSCEEALYFLNTCDLSRLDADQDGTPCESLCK